MGKPTVAIIGASGFVGKVFFGRFKKDFETIGTFHDKKQEGMLQLDIKKSKEVEQFLKNNRPEIIFHLAAITDVDLCEKNPALCQKVHVEGVENVAKAAKKYGARMVYISTDFVFDGKKGNYTEADSPNPANVYGKTKYLGEKMAEKADDYVIVRISMPYSSQYSSGKYIGWVIDKLENKKIVTAFADQIRTPTHAENLAECMCMLAETKYNGILNVCGGTALSMYDAGLEIASVFEFDKNLIKPMKGSEAGFAAFRPLNTSLSTAKAKKMGFPIKSFHDGIIEVKKYRERKGEA